jgi:hypothetical protein
MWYIYKKHDCNASLYLISILAPSPKTPRKNCHFMLLSYFRHKFQSRTVDSFLSEAQTGQRRRLMTVRLQFIWVTPLIWKISKNYRLLGGVRGGAGCWDTALQTAGSIPDGVFGVFPWLNPSGRNMVLGSTQPLTEMSTMDISWEVKAAGA